MSKEQKSDTTTDTKPSAAKATPSTGIVKQVQEQLDKENAQGFRGTEVDETPNENYTVAGVIAGKPTPETDAAAAKAVREKTGLGESSLEAAAREHEATAKAAANKKRGK